MSEDLVQILDGNTFVVSDSRGDIEASPTDPTGLFAFDTRFLSKWVLTVNGERLQSLSVDDLQYFETRFFLVPGTGTVYIDSKLSVIRQRAVGAGFHEELTILNHDDEPVELEIHIAASSDFADLFEVKDALQKKGSYFARVEKGRLLLGYERGTFERETIISAAAPARIDNDGLSFAITLEPHGSWTTELEVGASAFQRGVGRTETGDQAARNMQRALQRWLDDAPRLKCDCEPLQATYRRSLVDLAALRFSPPIAGGQQPARRRAAVVHDDVRPRQHPHEPAGACRSRPSSRRRRCARSGIGRGPASTTSATRTRGGSCTSCAMAR